MTRPSAAPAHTPEPPDIAALPLVVDDGILYVDHGSMGTTMLKIHSPWIEDAFDMQPDKGEADANMARLAACWNALAGVSDPAAVRALVEAARVAEQGIVAALDALDNDRLSGQYLRPQKRQSTNDRSMHAELAHVAMESEKRARAALLAIRAALAAFPDGATEGSAR